MISDKFDERAQGLESSLDAFRIEVPGIKPVCAVVAYHYGSGEVVLQETGERHHVPCSLIEPGEKLAGTFGRLVVGSLEIPEASVDTVLGLQGEELEVPIALEYNDMPRRCFPLAAIVVGPKPELESAIWHPFAESQLLAGGDHSQIFSRFARAVVDWCLSREVS